MAETSSCACRLNDNLTQPPPPQPSSEGVPAGRSPTSSRPSPAYPPPASLARAAFPCPPHGCKAICGARPRMEDAYTAVPFLLEVPISSSAHQAELVPVRIAGQVRSASGCLPEEITISLPPHSNSLPTQLPTRTSADAMGSVLNATAASVERSASTSAHPPLLMSALHFFGVFDGHGGADAALLCARTLHERLAEALASPPATAERHGPVERSYNSYSSTSTAVSIPSDADKAPAVALATAANNAVAAAAAANAIAEEDAQCGPSHGSNGSSMDMDEPGAADPSKTKHRQAVSISTFEQAFTDAFSKVALPASRPVLPAHAFL